MIPKINETYKFFDDGKINLSRVDEIKITDVISFDKIDDETLELWRNETQNHKQLYKEETDFFIKGYITSNKINLIFF